MSPLDPVERVNGVQVRFCKYSYNGPVGGVGAALDDGIEDAARCAAELGAELVLEKRNLGNRFVGDIDQRAGGVVVIVADAVEVKGVVLGTLSGDGRTRALADTPCDETPEPSRLRL